MYRHHHILVTTAVVACLVAAVIAPRGADASEGFEPRQFHPMPDQSVNFFGTASAKVPDHMQWSASLMLGYGHNPLVWRNEQGERVDSLVGHQTNAHLMGAVGLIDWFEIGLDLPLILTQSGSSIDGVDISGADGGVGLGDLRLVPKAQLFSTREHPGDSGVAAAVLIDLHLPTGNAEHLQGGDFRAGPRLAFDAVLQGVHLGANLGYRYRPATQVGNLQVRDTFGWNTGIEVPITDDLRATGELFGRLTTTTDQIRRRESPTEFLLGGKYRHDDLLFTLGGGAGLVNGYGTPDWRLFAGVSFATPSEEPQPPPEPEPQCHIDTVEQDCEQPDEPVCEDDVLITHAVECQDGECVHMSSKQPCAEDEHCGERDGQPACVPLPDCFEDADCDEPPATTCDDGVLTHYVGKCLDGECEYEPQETFCAEDEQCGLEEGKPACVPIPERVQVEEERIEINEVIHFELDSAAIDERSHDLLNEVASAMHDHPEITQVRIEGHTDDTGDRDYNVQLSEERAEAVHDYLVAAGIDDDRLHAVGLGPDEPIADNATAEGREQNRRVEFHIEQREPLPEE